MAETLTELGVLATPEPRVADVLDQASQVPIDIAGASSTLPASDAAQATVGALQNGADAAGTAAPEGFWSLFLPSGADPTWTVFFESMAWLCLLIAVLYLLLWIFKKSKNRFMGGSTPQFTIESRLSLGPQKWIVVARFLDKRLLLGVTEHNITLLTELDINEDKPEAAPKQNKEISNFLNAPKPKQAQPVHPGQTPKPTPGPGAQPGPKSAPGATRPAPGGQAVAKPATKPAGQPAPRPSSQQPSAPKPGNG